MRTRSPPDLARSLRTWTHASGHFQVHGSFVATHGDQVQVRKEDGGLLDIKLKAPERLRPGLGRAARRRDPPGEQRGGRSCSWPRARPARPGGDAGQPEPVDPRGTSGRSRIRSSCAGTGDFFYVESNGIPDHPMMVGITAWQQQVPLPQTYTGDNAWRIPLHPVPREAADVGEGRTSSGARSRWRSTACRSSTRSRTTATPTPCWPASSTSSAATAAGPTTTTTTSPRSISNRRPARGSRSATPSTAMPSTATTSPTGRRRSRLDVFNGHEDAQRGYHYHATKTYPYLNGGFHGEVTERGGQVDPQPNAQPVRPALAPAPRSEDHRLHAARSPAATASPTRFAGKKNFVNYTITPNGAVTFQFVDSAGKTTTETYQRRERGPGGGPGGRPPAVAAAPGPRPAPGASKYKPSPFFLVRLKSDLSTFGSLFLLATREFPPLQRD